MDAADWRSDGGQSALSGSTRVKKLYSLRRVQQDVAHEPSLKVPATKPRAAWGEDSPVWLADSFLAPADRYIFGEVDRPPPELNETPPDRSLVTHRDRCAVIERRHEEENRARHSERLVKATDFTRLPRRRRIQMLESLEKDEVSPWPGPTSFRRQELWPMRQVASDRARREFLTRWGHERPREVFRTEEESSSGSTNAADDFELLVPCGPGEIFPENRSARVRVRDVQKERPIEGTEAWWIEKRSKEEKDLKTTKFSALLQELVSALASETAMEAMCATHLAHLGKALEARCYTLRLDQICPALKLLGRAWKTVEAASKPSVTRSTLVVREHWRRMSEELRISCHFLAERVSAEALTGKISTVTKSLQALAESETCSQERLDAHLARIKELFRRESIHSPDIAKIAGAVGTARLAGAFGWKHLLADFKAILLEHLIEFREEEFYNMSWIFPTVYLTEIELRQVLARAAEIQVGLRPSSLHCLDGMRRMADFVVEQVPRFHASLSEFLQLYCERLRA